MDKAERLCPSRVHRPRILPMKTTGLSASSKTPRDASILTKIFFVQLDREIRGQNVDILILSSVASSCSKFPLGADDRTTWPAEMEKPFSK